MTIKVAIKSPRPGWKIQPVLAAPRWGGERERERGIQVIIPDDEIRSAILQEIGTALPSFVNVTILYQNYCCLGARYCVTLGIRVLNPRLP